MTNASISESDLKSEEYRMASDLPGLAAQIARETLMFETGPLAFIQDDDWDRVWELRAKAQDTRAHSLRDLQAKAAIIAGELQRDESALESDAPGSVIKLIESLLYDVLAMRLDA